MRAGRLDPASIAPRHERSRVVIAPPDVAGERQAGPPPAPWAGSPSAIVHGGAIWLAYRVAWPGAQGAANVVARSEDGWHFETVLELPKDRFDAMSLERPALVVTPEGRWRLYVSCATPGTKHWWIGLLEADDPEGLLRAEVRSVFPGDPRRLGVKDPVLLYVEERWHAWIACHPLEDPDSTDRITTGYATSEDGISWSWHGTVLRGRPGLWDGRAARITAVVPAGDACVALYDGRASAEENWEERTGTCEGHLSRDEGRVRFGDFRASGREPAAESPHAARGLRYAAIAHLPSGEGFLYYEATRDDGAHEIRAEILER